MIKLKDDQFVSTISLIAKEKDDDVSRETLDNDDSSENDNIQTANNLDNSTDLVDESTKTEKNDSQD